MGRCVVCKNECDRTVGRQRMPLHEGACEERFEEFATPAPKHLGLERDKARARFGQREEIKKDEDD